MEDQNNKESTLIFTKITDENRQLLLYIELSKCIGKICQICNKKYESMEEILKANPIVFSNNDRELEFACKKCIDKS